MIGRVLLRLGWLAGLLFLQGCAFHQSIGASAGAYLDPVTGHDFVHIQNDRWNQSTEALLYFYRPHSQWAADELESPDFYIDGKHYFNLRDGSYTWLVVYPGKRHIVIRRPLLGLEGLGTFNLDKIADVELDAKAGHIYYLRYSEIAPPKTANPDLPQDSPLGKGDFQLVAHDYAIGEIEQTRFLKPNLMAPNKGARSIVTSDRDYDFKQRKAALEKEKAKQLQQMKKQGFWHKAPWYWPFGGGPTREPAAQRKLDALEKTHQAYLDSLEQNKEANGGSSWFGWLPFMGGPATNQGTGTAQSADRGATAQRAEAMPGERFPKSELSGQSYESEKARLEKQREAELKRMKAQGFWRAAPWYWPFGGGPTRVPEAERKLQALEKAHKAQESPWLSWLPF